MCLRHCFDLYGCRRSIISKRKEEILRRRLEEYPCNEFILVFEEFVTEL